MAPKKMVTMFILSVSFCLFFSAAAHSFDLTGDWTCNDGGTYYLRQDGRNVWWYGERDSEKTPWSNVAYGDIVGNQLHLQWVDVPKGSVGGKGRLILEIRDNSRRLEALKREGGFGGSSWTKRNSGF